MSEELPSEPHESTFGAIARLIEERRERVFRAVNFELVDLYWEIGKS